MRDAIRGWYRSISDVRPGERAPVALLCAYGFFAMGSYYILRAVREATFVERVGSEMLSYVYVLTAVFVIALMLVYSRYADRIRARALLLGTFAFLGVSLVGFWWLLADAPSEEELTWVPWALFVFSKLYPLLIVSQFWLVGNLLFTTRQAKRLFGIVGLALILGGVAGSEITARYAEVLGSRTLLLLVAAPLPVCAAFVLALGPRLGAGAAASARVVREFRGDAVRLLMGSSHLRNIAGVLALTIVVGTLLHWQLGRAVDLFVPTEDAKAAFFGVFYRNLNIVSAAVQLFFTGFVLRRFGVGVALLVLPLALFGASIAVFAAPALITVALAKGSEGALRYSLDQSTRELLFLPVPNETLYKVKPVIDLAVYRGASGVAGLLLMLATNVLGFGLRGVSVVCLACICVWVGLALRMRSRYADTLARSLGTRTVGIDELLGSAATADSRPLIGAALSGTDPRHAAFALDLVDREGPVEIARFSSKLHGLLSHEDPLLRRRSLGVLARAPDTIRPGAIRVCLSDPDEAVRVGAVDALVARAEEPGEVLRDLMSSPEASVRLAALEVLADRHSPDEETIASVRALHRARTGTPLDTQSAEGRREVAVTAGLLGSDGTARGAVLSLTRDPDDAVASAALRSLARSSGDAAVGALVDGLSRPGTRPAAREALLGLGVRAVPELVRRMADPDTPAAARRAIPRVLAEIPTQESVDALIRSYMLPETDQWLDDRSLAALQRLRRQGDLTFERGAVLEAVDRELVTAALYGRALTALGDPVGASPQVSLLRRSLEEARVARLDSVFDWLALCYPQEDVRRCRRALGRGDEHGRSNAREWLEHTLGHALFDRVRPAFGDAAASAPATSERRVPSGGHGSTDAADALTRLARDEDRWIASCASWTIAAHPEIGAEPIEGADPDLPERVLMLTRNDLLGAVPSDHIAVLASIAEELEIPPRAPLLRAGRRPDAMYMILEGQARLTPPAGGEPRTLEAGSSIGSWTLVDDSATPLDVEADTPMRVLRIERTRFHEVLEELPELGLHLLAGLAHRVRQLAPHPGAYATPPVARTAFPLPPRTASSGSAGSSPS
ncbi:MAG: HEAT repeat domain-containing protein [Gemmatimonadota bacterium]|nr:HEAT repeat domain-containing protein [Gemmatimonadota bacterium]